MPAASVFTNAPNRVCDLLGAARRALIHSDSTHLDPEVLLANVMRCGRTWLYAHDEAPVSWSQAARFRDLIEKRRAGYPVAYLIGNREFWSLSLKVDETTLIPRPETECLVETALFFIAEHAPMTVLDLGTGSGAIALALARERPDCRVIATDVSREALAVAESNAAVHGLDNIEFIVSDWFQALDGRRFDVIISNPPYLRRDDEHLNIGDVRFEPRMALISGDDGMQALTSIIRQASAFLKDGGRLLLEHGYDQQAQTHAALRANGFEKIAGVRDFSGWPRVAYGNV